MIQRIQSLFLALVVLSQVLVSQFSFASFNKEGLAYTLTTSGILNSDGNPVLEDHKQLILTIIISVLAIASVFLFKNRKLQIKATTILSYVILAQVAFIGTSIYRLSSDEIESFQIGTSSFLSVVSMILTMMASKAIKKDENLVKSVDRIR